MPKSYVVDGTEYRFPDEMNDQQVHDVLVKQGVIKPPTGQHWSDTMGLQNPVARGAVDLAEGAASGLASTIYHGGDLIRRGLGMERIINKPEAQQAMTPPDSLAGKAGKFIEQGAEFIAPMGAVSKATKGASLLARMGAEGLASGAVAGVQSGGNPGATAAGVAAGAAGPALGAAVDGIAGSRLPQKIYQSALKPTWSMVKKDGLTMLDTGLKEQIPVSAEGLGIIEKRINDIRKDIEDGIQMHAAKGRTVDTSKVLSRLDDLEKFYQNTAAPEDALKTIQGIRDQFEQYHGQQIPIDKAQQIKINTYQELKKSYGEMASAKIEGLKQVARGLKEEISSVFPEISTLNEQQSKLLGLDDALYRAVWRIENHQMMGIGSGIAAGAGGAILGGPGALAAFAGKLLLDDPTIKSKLAIGLAKAGAGPGVFSARLAALRGTLTEAAAAAASTGNQSPAMAH